MPFMLRDLQEGISYQRLRDISFTDTGSVTLFCIFRPFCHILLRTFLSCDRLWSVVKEHTITTCKHRGMSKIVEQNTAACTVL